MSIDAVFCRRQKKWKFIIILLSLAVLSLVAALVIIKKERVLSSLPVGDGAAIWSETGAGRDAKTAVTDSGVYLLTKGRLTNLKDSAKGMDNTVTGDTMVGGFCLALYESLGREIYLTETNGELSLPGRILSVSVGRERYLSAIISASGYQTKTIIFSEIGEIIGEIPLKEKIMVESVFLREDSILASLCLSDGGLWECLLFSLEGETLHSIPLDDVVCYELLPLYDYAAVRTDSGIAVISSDGELISEINGVIDCWAVSDYYISSITGNTLKTYLPDGSLLGEVSLQYHPNSISISGNRIYIHYGEGLGCYSPLGEELWFRKDGSIALAVQPTKWGCILIPYHETS